LKVHGRYEVAIDVDFAVDKGQRYRVGIRPGQPLLAALVAGNNLEVLRLSGRSRRATNQHRNTLRSKEYHTAAAVAIGVKLIQTAGKTGFADRRILVAGKLIGARSNHATASTNAGGCCGLQCHLGMTSRR